jgi:molybdate transport system ATP-binding protein
MAPGRPVRLRVLARDVSLTLEVPKDTSIQNHFPGRVEAIADDAHPSQALVRVRCGDSVVLARVTRKAIFELNLTVGAPVWVQVKSVAMR